VGLHPSRCFDFGLDGKEISSAEFLTEQHEVVFAAKPHVHGGDAVLGSGGCDTDQMDIPVILPITDADHQVADIAAGPALDPDAKIATLCHWALHPFRIQVGAHASLSRRFTHSGHRRYASLWGGDMHMQVFY
jgi:hypothetical protein